MPHATLTPDAWRAHWKACWQAHQQGAFIRPGDREAWLAERRALDAIEQDQGRRVCWRAAGLVLAVPPPLVFMAAHWHWSAWMVGWATLAVGLLGIPWVLRRSDCWGTLLVRSRRQDLERAPLSTLTRFRGDGCARARLHLIQRQAQACGLLEGDVRCARRLMTGKETPSERSQYIPAQAPTPPQES